MSKKIDAPTRDVMALWKKTKQDIIELNMELFKTKYPSEIDAFIRYIVQNKNVYDHFKCLHKAERIMIFESIVDNYESILPLSKSKRDKYRVELEKRKNTANNKKN